MKNELNNLKLEIKSDLKNLKEVESLSKKIAKEMGLSQDVQDNLSIAITEATGNAITHGNKNDPEKNVGIDVKIYPDEVKIAVSDEGGGFNLEELDDPLDPANLMKDSGRGIFIMKALMDEVKHTFSKNGTVITLTLKKGEEAE